MEEHLITLPRAQNLLASKIPSFVSALGMTMKTWTASPPVFHQLLDESARATVMHRFWYGFVEQNLRQDSDVEFKSSLGQRFLVVSGKVVVRFKLVDRYYLSKNYPTKRSLAWKRQDHLRGIPPASRVEFGYIPDITGTVLVRACMLLRLGNDILWVWQVLGERDNSFFSATPVEGTDLFDRQVFAYDDYSASLV